LRNYFIAVIKNKAEKKVIKILFHDDDFVVNKLQLTALFDCGVIKQE
jgi:hypothetical protein